LLAGSDQDAAVTDSRFFFPWRFRYAGLGRQAIRSVLLGFISFFSSPSTRQCLGSACDSRAVAIENFSFSVKCWLDISIFLNFPCLVRTVLGLGGNVVATVAVVALFVAKRNAPRTEVTTEFGPQLIT
jgi:hypothetical protein